MSKKKIEYMFYGYDPLFPQEMNRIMEKGFRSTSECDKIGMCSYPALFNTLLSTDLPRIHNFLS